MVNAVARIYARCRSLQIPILRVHCDRAREFTSAAFRSWVEGRSMHLTFSAGDEPTGNSRIEREIGVIKGRTRILLKSSHAPINYWPLAARHALEERCRHQLWSLGIKSPKTGHNLGSGRPRKVRCWADRVQTCGKFMRSTVVIVPHQTATSVEELRQDLRRASRKKSIRGGTSQPRTRLCGGAHLGRGETWRNALTSRMRMWSFVKKMN